MNQRKKIVESFLPALFCIIVLAASSWWALSAQERIGGPSEAVSYAPKPTKLTTYNPPHKPHTRLEEVKTRHKGQAEWSEWVIKDDLEPVHPVGPNRVLKNVAWTGHASISDPFFLVFLEATSTASLHLCPNPLF